MTTFRKQRDMNYLKNLNRKCGEITFCTQVGKRVYTLNCLYCSQICLQWDIYIHHMEDEHGDDLNFDPVLQAKNDETEILMDNDESQEQITPLIDKLDDSDAFGLDDPLEGESSTSQRCLENTFKIENVECLPNLNLFHNITNSQYKKIETDKDKDEMSQIPRSNVGLQPIPKFKVKTSSCQNCLSIKNFEGKFNSTIQNLQEIIVNQNKVLMEALAEQKSGTNNTLHNTFPIQTIDGLSDINTIINEINREEYVQKMKSLLNGRLSKTLTEVISSNVCMGVNLDGIHGKKRLRDFKAFFDALTDACRSTGSNEVEKDIRAALKVIKKRHIHAKFMSNKNSTNLSN